MLQPYCIHGVTEAGCDEAGRGPLAGSVFAAAVILPPDCNRIAWCRRLNDSKQLNANERSELRLLIEKESLAWGIGEVSAEEIDRINILNAALLAMHRALDKLSVRPEHLIIDGNRWKPYVPDGLLEIPARTIVKGDSRYMSIAAASILAKTYRDDYMQALDAEYPQYGWAHNMGYPTYEHYAAIRQYGVSPYHRKSFRLEKQLKQATKNTMQL